MYAYISGKINYKNPAYVVLDNNGIGYAINISLQTYSQIQEMKECKLHIYFHVKEDAQVLYGFFDEAEKNLFTNLISVSGIGPNTGRMILSSFPPEDLRRAIIREDVKLIQSIKGIGPKSAQRLILELKDKLKKEPSEELSLTVTATSNTSKEEALSAMVMLGFSKSDGEKIINKVLKQNPQIDKVEDLIKEALKNM